MRRALERAGNRIKGRAGRLRDTTRGVSAELAAATVGPTLLADGGLSPDELLEGAYRDLVVRYQVWATQTADEAGEIVGTLVGEWRTGYPAAMKATQAEHIADSAQVLETALLDLTKARLFDSAILTSSSDLVPVGFVRHVLAIAGGTANITTSGHAYVALTTPTLAPVPGLATGPDVTDVVRDHGGSVEAYRWVYGPAQRGQPFPPHRRLDGRVFVNFDDPVLANTSGWPPFSHYMPGDHSGCRCDYEPVIVPPSAIASTRVAPRTPTSAPAAPSGAPAQLTDRQAVLATQAQRDAWLERVEGSEELRPLLEHRDRYVGNSEAVNNALRTGELSAENRRTVRGMDELIARTGSPLRDDVTYWRGARLPDDVSVGQVVRDDGYLSVTASEYSARGFAGQSGGSLLRFQDANGRAIPGSRFEAEQIVERGAGYRIVGVSDDPMGYKRYDVELLPPE